MTSPIDQPAASGAAVGEPDQTALKAALLSVYYASIGDRFDVSGAPSAFVPPEVAPQPLADALAVLADDPDRLDQALWQIIRNTPIRQAGERAARYPPEIAPYLSVAEQAILDELRAEYRMGASVLAACLRACHHDDRDLFDALVEAASTKAIKGNEGFRRVVRLLYDQTPAALLDRLRAVSGDADLWTTERDQIDEIEAEVGLGIATYVERLAATAAYESFLHRPGRSGRRADHPDLAIFPVASVISQSTSQLWTCATVTTLAHGQPDALLAATEPDRWHDGSDVIETSRYVADAYSLAPATITPGPDGNLAGLLYEVATMSWGLDESQRATFRNVLNVRRSPLRVSGHRRLGVDVSFSLHRSISSDVLWDHRLGGITLNEGFLRVVPLGGGRWRVTSRKLLRFSDRTPNSGSSGWSDFGQMLNYLAPAALSWWVDTETYSLGARTQQDQAAAVGQAPANDTEDDHDD